MNLIGVNNELNGMTFAVQDHISYNLEAMNQPIQKNRLNLLQRSFQIYVSAAFCCFVCSINALRLRRRYFCHPDVRRYLK